MSALHCKTDCDHMDTSEELLVHDLVSCTCFPLIRAPPFDISPIHEQVAAFKDFTPGSGASAAPAAAAQEEPEEEEEEEDDATAESSGSGGDYPPHTVMGLPALSPTMSQGNDSCSCSPTCKANFGMKDVVRAVLDRHCVCLPMTQLMTAIRWKR